ncbi:hypothetical protein V6N12_065739 [Hibiscus sabdariffa]|uniref:Ubiquinol-cytochrome C reductase hinge domain-containing protein n=1 Tax=Hibiscus sabdariffa TaxID=183260 RepID=A0ABR2G9K3_9ROSI
MQAFGILSPKLLVFKRITRGPPPNLLNIECMRIGSGIVECEDFNHQEADEEPVDQKKTLESVCQSGCAKPKHGYEECVKRISGDDTGTKHCTGQYFDYLACVDKCVAPKLFAKLK